MRVARFEQLVTVVGVAKHYKSSAPRSRAVPPSDQLSVLRIIESLLWQSSFELRIGHDRMENVNMSADVLGAEVGALPAQVTGAARTHSSNLLHIGEQQVKRKQVYSSQPDKDLRSIHVVAESSFFSWICTPV